MASKPVGGSVYHLSSLRYAEGSTSISQSSSLVQTTTRSRLDEIFEKAEDDYRPGQSNSSSLLIRSNVLSVDTALDPSDEQSQARDGFLRTKARAVLASSTPIGGAEEEDALLGVHLSELGSSIYLRNRRAKNPLTRAGYDKLRTKKREVRERAKARKKSRSLEEEATPTDDEDVEERNVEKDRAERIKAEMQVDADSLVPQLPSGSLMETIHYIAAHYYDARGMLMSRDGPAPKKSIGANMWRVGEGSALVALGVYLEEMAKYQIASYPSTQEHQESGDTAKDVAGQLSKLQKEAAKARRRQKGKKVAGKKTAKLIANGWARDRRERRTKPAAALQGGDDKDSQSDTGEEQDEQEGEEESSSSDGIDFIDESSSGNTDDTSGED